MSLLGRIAWATAAYAAHAVRARSTAALRRWRGRPPLTTA
jgi:hypothetical protein